eukprot:788190-Alexandrium_andersonii.AAC.1
MNQACSSATPGAAAEKAVATNLTMMALRRYRTRATERKRVAPAAPNPAAAKAACTSFSTSREPPDRKREAPARRAGE